LTTFKCLASRLRNSAGPVREAHRSEPKERRKEERIETGIRGLDAGCGRGRILLTLARLFPRSYFLGLDISEEAIADAQAQAARDGCDNVEFRVADLTNFQETAAPQAFELVTTFDAIHDQARPRHVLAGIWRTLTPDGVYLMQDISGAGRLQDDIHHPLGTLLYTVSCLPRDSVRSRHIGLLTTCRTSGTWRRVEGQSSRTGTPLAPHRRGTTHWR
jgi:2-polyprenyl-3-methyl-5-hydroxy-6-metoxy-1,4-benzoquinol methylase